MAGEKVTLGFEITGVQQAKSDVESVTAALTAMVGGMNQQPGMGMSGAAVKVPGAPSNAPGLTNGLGEYATPINGTPAASSLAALTGILGPSATSFTTNRSIATPAPDPHNTGGSWGPSAFASASPSPSAQSSGGGVLNVNIVGSIPLLFAGGGGNGGNGGQGGGGSIFQGGGGGGGGGGQGGGTPAHPYTGNFNPFNANGLNNLARTALGFVQNPASLMEMIPAPLALGAAAITTGFQFAGANFAATRPKFDLETSLLAAPGRGQLISPLLKSVQDKVAADRGDQAYYEAHRSTIYGLAGRIGSLGAADWYYNTHIRPDIDRRTEIDQANAEGEPSRLRFLAATGGRPSVTDGSLGIQSSLLSPVGSFGSRAMTALGNTSFKSLTDKGWSPEEAGGVGNTVLSVAMSQQNGALYGQVASGANILGMASSALPGLIAKADVNGINSLRPQLGSAATDAAITQARQTYGLGVTSQIDQSKFSSLGSQVSLLGATGAGYRQIAGAIGTQSNSLDAVKGDLQKQMGLAAAAGNTGDVAAIGLQINQANAQQAQMHQQQAMTIFSGRGVDNQGLAIGASNTMYQATYGAGTAAAVDVAFAADRKAKLASAKLDEDMSKSTVISPQEREVYRQSAIQKRQQATIGVDREKSQFDYSITQGKIGVQDARADVAVTRSRLFGDQESDYRGALGKANVTGAQLNAVTARLGDPTAHLSEQERLDLQRQQISLQNELNRSMEDAKRSLLGMRVATDQAQSSIVHMGNSVQMQFFGAGGQAAGNNQVGEIGANRKTLGDAQKNFNYYEGMVKSGKMSASNPDYLKAKQGLLGAQSDLYGSEDAMATLPGTLASRNKLLDSQFAMQMGAKTFLPFGNMRGNIEGGMGAIGSQLKDLDANERKAVQAANQDHYANDADKQARLGDIAYKFKQQRYGLNGQLADMQSQLQQGWQDRLISQVVGAPSRMSFVASQFTQHEAAPFLQNTDMYNGSFGFGGKDGAQGRDDLMFRYSRYVGGMGIGNITRPEGFMDTAMSGAHAGVGPSRLVGGGLGRAGMSGIAGPHGMPGIHSLADARRAGLTGDMRLNMPGADWDAGHVSHMTGTLKAAVTEVRIILENHRTTVISGGKSQTVNHPGGNAGTIQSVNNGALTQSGSTHNLSGGSHQ